MTKGPEPRETEIGMIPEDWEVKEFSALFKVPLRNGLTRPTAVRGSGIKMVNMGELFAHDRMRNIIMERVPVSDKEKQDYLLATGDLMFARQSLLRSGVGKCSIFLEDDEDVTFEGHLIRVRLSEDYSPMFYYYFFKSEKGKSIIQAFSEQVAASGIRGSDLARIPVPVPSLSEQQSISKILSDLDSKIELNQQMNKTLEAIGRAIFKHWFIDFEFPNEEGEPYKSSGGKTKDSELGEIPTEWDIRTVGDVMELAYGKALRDDMRLHGTIPVFGSNGQIGWHDEKLVDGPGIIVGRKGNPGIVKWSQTDFFPIDTTFYVVPKHLIRSMHYLFYALQFQNLHSLAADSAVPGLNRNIVYTNKLVVPSPKILEAFDSRIRMLYAKVHVNDEQSRVLTEIRDSLLPKLMSGKIRVPVEVR